jgi:hypothetical protein
MQDRLPRRARHETLGFFCARAKGDNVTGVAVAEVNVGGTSHASNRSSNHLEHGWCSATCDGGM